MGDGDQRLAAARAALRLGDLWRRRLDARAHGAHGQAHPHRDSTLTPAAHLTCVDATRDEVDQVIAEFAGMGVKRFVALRGDPAEGVGARYQPHPGRLCQRRRTGRRR